MPHAIQHAEQTRPNLYVTQWATSQRRALIGVQLLQLPRYFLTKGGVRAGTDLGSTHRRAHTGAQHTTGNSAECC
ncbi:MAG: hypothetical protein KAX55_09650, partial [Propionivibrio sp.]|nr:hypothetical protein [Propionivibrio sp.]